MASSNPTLTILHVTAPGDAGGLERVVLGLAAGHGRRGHDVRVVTVIERSRSDHPFVQSLERAEVPVIAVELPVRAYRQERATIARICGEVQPDLLHTHGNRPDVIDSGIARRMGIPSVTTVHGFTGGGLKGRLYKRLQLAAFRRFDAVVAVSQPLGEQLMASGVSSERLHIQPNAWSGEVRPLDRAAARRALNIGEAGFRIGWVGRLDREKGADVLLEGLEQLRDIPVTASVLGGGTERRALEAQAASLGVDDRITWHGLVSDAARVLTAFDVFVLSSRTEGTPIALFEAMAAGVPLVVTAVGGVPHVVGDGEALLVPSEDPQALAAAVRAVYLEPERARTRAEAARARLATHFACEPWLDRYEAIYRGVMLEGGR